MAGPEKDKVLLVWDYDWSLINTNSDTFVVEALHPELMDRFESPIGWTQLMDQQVKELFSRGVTRERMEETVAAVPVFPGALEAIRCAHEAKANQMVLSDANNIFIEAFLRKEGLRHCFSEVISNPAEFDEKGRLNIMPFHEGETHGCPLCPSNLCKGRVLEEILRRFSPSRVAYVGDGGGDFCPACELRPQDLLLCRAPPSEPLKRFGLLRRLEGPTKATRHGGIAKVVAQVVKWHSGDDLLAAVMKYLNSTPLKAPEHFKGRELLHPGDDPLKSLIRQANEEESFRKATEFVLLHAPHQGNLHEEVKRRDAIQDAVSRRENTRPMLPVPLWEQRQHYASNLGRFCQSCERGGSHRSAKRMGEGVHFVEESDGIPAAGKTKTKYERNRLGILEGTVAKEGQSKSFKRPDGHSSGAPCQDHYFYERGHEAVDREMPLGKRLYPILKK
eukprot:symbB.v1.2.000195.t1/scaffold21.1/size436794/14